MKCIIIDKERKTRIILEQYVRQTTAFQLLKSFSTVEEALKIFLTRDIDVVFLDISMSGMDEVEFMKSIDHNNTQLIIIADSEKYAKAAFDFDVVDYLVRPITWERFLKAIGKARRLLQTTHVQNGNDEILFIKENNKLIKIQLTDIYYIKSVDDYVSIKAGDKKYVVHETMKNLAEKIGVHFMRVHQSYIVNITRIITIEDSSISIDNTLVPIGRTYKKELIRRLKLL